ncbi:LuxR C-terminal-related transcriptional regulator [Streptomyces atratus]|uniref:LuxR C-terminal-related transcriptional regulator n=1 Tax=Streptomyces atratus TaxID=1893 RepID=UPI0037DA5A85
MSVTAGGYRPGLTLPPCLPRGGWRCCTWRVPHCCMDSTRLVAMALSYADGVRYRVERPTPRCARLFISVGTVKTHVAHIQAELGVANRVGIAAWTWEPGRAAP